MIWSSDKRFLVTLILCGSLPLFAIAATNHGTDDAAPAPTSTATTAPSNASGHGQSHVAGDDSQTTTSSATVSRPYTRNGVYLMMDSANFVRYVGRGDVHDRIKAHLNSGVKSHLTPVIVWEQSLTWYEMMSLEQALMDLYGGSRSSTGWEAPLLNEVRSYSRTNDEACLYQWAVTDDLWKATMQRLGYMEMYPRTRFAECYTGTAGR